MKRCRFSFSPVAIFVCLFSIAALISPASAADPLEECLKKPDDWYRSDEGRRALENVLSWQSERGDWPKNTDTVSEPFSGKRKKIEGTFDNGATTGQLRLLARACRVTGEARYEEAVLKGLDHILQAQYPTGGWPQSYPPGKDYPRHITFNDNAMVRLMELLRDAAESDDYSFVDPPRRERCGTAFDKGIECILRCQVKVDGRLTVWCAQHDEENYQPRPARSYELVSLSGCESAAILRLLMSLEEPSPEVVRAVEAGAAWFEKSRLWGIRVVSEDDDKVVVRDADAPPLWARFYEIETNRSIFCGRDGVKQYEMARIEKERRTGYAWYGDWGEEVEKTYIKWKAKRGER